MANRMNPEVKARWVAALRSGEYKQARGRLKKDGGFCCLGVLCDLHSRETGANGWDHWGYKGSTALPPREVRNWAGLTEDFGAYVVIEGDRAGITEHNDGLRDMERHSRPMRSFAEIAQAIEEQL